MVDVRRQELETLRLWIENAISYKEINIEESVCDEFGITPELYKELTTTSKKLIEFLTKSISKHLSVGETIENIQKYYENSALPKNIIKYLLKPPDENDDENEDDISQDEHDITNDITKFEWRENQLTAINETIKQNFSSGVHNQIMGAGKTYIMLSIISKHYDMHKKKMYYIVMCDRQEILKQMINVDEKKKLYKEYGIIDLDLFDIIDCVNHKPKSIFENTGRKPIIVFVNNTFLRVRDNEKLNSKNTALVLLDECHSVSAPETYKLLRQFKYEKHIPIIGFSATPLREHAEIKLKDIFSNTYDDNAIKKLNIISSYDYPQSLSDDITLPFKYDYVEVTKPVKGTLTQYDKLGIKKIIDDICKTLPYRKMIAWCGTIEQMKEWYKFFEDQFQNLKVFMTSCADKKYEDKYNCNYDEFANLESDGILLCVNRCREGVDIKHVDCGIYLDAVKKRSILVCMQTAGRVLRPDIERRKRRAHIINIFVNDSEKSIDVFTAQHIFSYYLQIINLADDSDVRYEEHKDLYNKIMQIKNNTKFDEKNQLVTIKVDDKLKHNTHIQFNVKTKSIDWNFIKEYLDKELDRKFKIEKDKKFKIIIERLKETGMFTRECDFWKVYDEIKDEMGLPNDLYNEYKNEFDTKTWYELLDIDTGEWSVSLKKIKKMLHGKYDGDLTRKKYKKIAMKNPKLPIMPQYIFKYRTFKLFSKLLDVQNIESQL